ncbi:hypothetical protein LTR10_015984 [Elasticomyces elasticus]|uniref:SnoaL-like domain-containing protein n=1 Tax=Exophiala sideris TaxID=1016849 RepID=A0ABR0J264_9EURO|nr:hypothetical protein LTR10_015984 [Elasticomyces elasticus]KAK5024678.1 hypothetical protein LTS07_008524 [Exophiala sideris]KAK5030771.1 hypothetical protein LTR13_008125 [Exophiala sideris]KAK5054312.1 hypothetical protein LTR69_008927 [Exophiala sideris]KAK5179714.1 hypothetical protein LTR44_007882 [Eurotiomycetes sp. CCFEE 6388]
MSSLESRLERLEGYHEIKNVMGCRAYYHSAGRHELEINELWSSKEDVVFEAEDWGAWVTRKAVWRAYVEGNPFPGGTEGLLIEHHLTTEVLEIAEDGLTAKGVWLSPGHETFPVPGEKLPKAHWSWLKYAVDFRKEDGKWKIWHLHVFTIFRTPYNMDWAEVAYNRPPYFPEDGLPMESVGKVDRGVSFNEPYHPERAPKMQPAPPEPYKTWKDTWSATDFYVCPK